MPEYVIPGPAKCQLIASGRFFVPNPLPGPEFHERFCLGTIRKEKDHAVPGVPFRIRHIPELDTG